MPHQLGLIAQIILYLIPGIVVFLFLPSLIFSYFESWTYSEAIYYSFVTLSTIGFGDYVPTFAPNQVWSPLKIQKNQYSEWIFLITVGNIWLHVLRLRSVYHILVYLWSWISCHDNGIYSQVSIMFLLLSFFSFSFLYSTNWIALGLNWESNNRHNNVYVKQLSNRYC